MKTLFSACFFAVILLTACQKDNNPSDDDDGGNNNGGNNNGTLAISSTSPEFVFWGDELTINGSGFSTTKIDNIVYVKGNKACDPDTTWQQAEVVSATASRLVVKAPYFVKQNGGLCGPDYGRVRVTVNGKSAQEHSDSATKFVGPPEMGLCQPFGVTINSAPPNTYRPGDSSVMTVHLHTLYSRSSGYYDKLKLYVNGALLNTVDRYWEGATCGGLTFVLDPMTYADINNCNVPDGYNYGPARKMTFVAKVDGTSYADTTENWVLNHPKTVITGKEGPSSVSKSAGGNPYVHVMGKYMYFNDIEWSTLQGAPGFHSAPPAHDLNTTDLPVYIPLSLMEPNIIYTATGVSTCTGSKHTLFDITIKP